MVVMMRLVIERMDHQGRGIAFFDGKITFVINGLIGEKVEADIIEEHAKYNLAIAKVIIKVSSKRVASDCPYFIACGGCSLRNMKYEDTLEYKEKRVKNILDLNKIMYPEIRIVANQEPNNYRDKVTFKIRDGQIGFFKENSHDLCEVENCLLASGEINRVLKVLPKLKINKGEVVVRVNDNQEVLIVINTENKINFDENFFENVKLCGVVVNNKTIYGENFLIERMHNCLFKVSYDAFFQVNHYITQKLWDMVQEQINLDDVVLDLYSGVGTLSIIAAKKAKTVYSIEVVKNAVLDTIFNCKINNVTNVKSFLGKVKDLVAKIDENFDVVIVDPPRSGLEKETLQVIMDSNIKKIIYISCDTLTLARDLKVLQEKYVLKELNLLDMFSYTYHVECVCVLTLR